MTKLKFAIASDLHITLLETIYDHPKRFHLVEYSIPVFEVVLQEIGKAGIDFLLLPGDLTQHGELENHQWLVSRLRELPYPVFVIPGNHDIVVPRHSQLFPELYRQFGYQQTDELYYVQELLPTVRLIGLNSNIFDGDTNQLGRMDIAQIIWLENILQAKSYPVNLLMIHHNIINHVPDQGNNPLGRRYLLENAETLCEILHKYQVHFVFTGHLHVQDIAYDDRYQVYDITTGSLVSYPHPYRIVEIIDEGENQILNITSYRVKAIPEQADLLYFSREWMGDRSAPFVKKFLINPPLCLPSDEADKYLDDLRYFWSKIADGDAVFEFPHFPEPLRSFLEGFSDRPPQDNNVVLTVRK
ncbi:MAG: metallophosphoesterase family protein [Pseudanabaenaceae cyanobacterium]